MAAPHRAIFACLSIALASLLAAPAFAERSGSTGEAPVAAAAKKKCKKKHHRKRRCRKGQGSSAADVRPLTADEQLLLSRKLWFEYDFDGDGVCYLYQFGQVSPGVLNGGRSSYFVNPFTGACRISEPYISGSPFVWGAANGGLTVQFVSGFAEGIQLQPYDAASDSRGISRANTGLSAWAACRNKFFPLTLSAGCV